jgi:FKBP12-rapamycin complex-associated protein
LITINTELQQPDAARSILAKQSSSALASLLPESVELSAENRREAEVYEKLHDWEQALESYRLLETAVASQPGDTVVHIVLKQWKCLAELADWEQLAEEVQASQCEGGAVSASTVDETARASKLASLRRATISGFNLATNKRVAAYGAAAAWNLGQWEHLRTYVGNIGEEYTEEGSFLQAVLAVHRGDHIQAAEYIDSTRGVIEQRLTEVVSDTYARAYEVVFSVQQLSELSEVIEYKGSGLSRQQSIRRMWDQRLKFCQPRVEFWQRSLAIRALVIPPLQDIDVRLKFASLCRKNRRTHVAKVCLSTLLGVESNALNLHALQHLQDAPHHVVFAYLKLTWLDESQRAPTVEALHNYIQQWEHINTSSHMDSFLAVCHRKSGNWQRELSSIDAAGALTHNARILESFQKATQLNPRWFKAWSSWALMNYEVATRIEEQGAVDVSEVVRHMSQALNGFVQSIRHLGHSGGCSALQDVLRLLTVWFRYGEHREVYDAVDKLFPKVHMETWLQVIPQIVARIDIGKGKVRKQIRQLLIQIGKEHPQSLLFSLNVSAKSDSPARKQAVEEVLVAITESAGQLITDTELVSRELDRVAVLWNEEWHAGLEEACKAYFTHGDVDGMLAQLQKLQRSMDAGAETMREISFQQSFGSQLREAWDWIQRYKNSKSRDDLNRAWNIYFTEFQAIAKTLGVPKVELQYVSPKLLYACELELAVPGTYRAGTEVVRIVSVDPVMDVLPSKQRPRRLKMRGSDGKDYEFLLKGKEDIRLDERVMQLFGLINTMLSSDVASSRHDLGITRYDVVPLSPTSGLLGWVANTDTLNVLIKGYREARNIRHHVEQGLMLQAAPKPDIHSYDKLSLLQKVEAFEYALANTKGQDLKQVLWLNSRNSEVWLDRRNMYTRSLATMSMVGYVLGLGDRHPSNLMLHRHTGKVVHIDFGDCFDVAMQREKYPERVPFRLTRMLVNTMEVSGIDGNFRKVCEEVLGLMRREKDSLIAMLEAFVHDPLISWRLVTQTATSTSASVSSHGDGPWATGSLRVGGGDSAVPAVAVGSSTAGSVSISGHRSYSLVEQQSRGATMARDTVNKTARTIIRRISTKLTGANISEVDMIDAATPVGRQQLCFVLPARSVKLLLLYLRSVAEQPSKRGSAWRSKWTCYYSRPLQMKTYARVTLDGEKAQLWCPDRPEAF